VEFWNVATRPLDRNGFGLDHARTNLEIQRLEGLFELAADSAAIYPEWRNLVRTIGVSGVQVHDARLAAVMRVHGLTHILTFNPSDFSRYPGVIPIHPSSV
jgi:predicted nucleic acid-binding protein